MPQIFVFPAGDAVAQQNLAISVQDCIPEDRVFGAVEEDVGQERERLERILGEANGFYAWGAQPSDDDGNERTWEAMERGDYVLTYYGRAYHYVSRVLDTFHSPELARAIWDEDARGETWEYLYFLTEPKQINAPTSWVASSLGLSSKEYRRFAKVGPEKVASILSAQSSIENLVDRLLDTHEDTGAPPGEFAPVTDRDLSELDDDRDLDRAKVDREMAVVRDRLAEAPRLKEGLASKVTRASARPRSAAFEVSVKRLYGYRCAICGSGLRSPKGPPEVQSAHIYPKRFDGSDDVRNGICLCRRHHWAMDAGWISIADDYTVLVRDDLPDHDDYQFIGEYEGERIRLSAVADSVPDTIFLREHRRLMGFE
jgi:putative restriction endonuclease